MLFNSFAFLIFFPLVCLLYFLIPYRYRWAFLLVASYYFYMNWQPTYALLILGSTVITYVAGLKIAAAASRRRKKIYLIASLVINFAILFVFKYYNFINGAIFGALDFFGLRWPIPNFDILLPVGISFYTFQAVGYSIDVYRGDLKAERHFGIYALFVSFFPQLVAGPIERAGNLLHQFRMRFEFDSARAVSGLKLMLWGYFMKVVVADRVGMYVDAVYNNVEHHSGASLALATVLFAVQIYCDFGGYSNIAIGAARVMGFSLMKNFNRPYFATSVKDFWSRWHISLSTWFRDYVYIPLGGNRVKPLRHLFNLFVTFVISGAWHGANWTFVAWGALHGAYLIVAVLKNKYLPRMFDKNKLPVRICNTVVTFVLVSTAWIFFRASDLASAFEAVGRIASARGGELFVAKQVLVYSFIGVSILFTKDFIDEFFPRISVSNSRYAVVRYGWAVGLVCMILLFGVFDGGQFIYFQF